jgi:hypothetical protein
VLKNRHIGEVPLDEAIDRFYTADVFMHTWDLARATGQDDRLDPDFCALPLAGMVEVEDACGPRVSTASRLRSPDDPDVQSRMLGFVGRDPQWTGGNAKKRPTRPRGRPTPTSFAYSVSAQTNK